MHPGRSLYFFLGLVAANSGLSRQSPPKHRTSTDTNRCLAKRGSWNLMFRDCTGKKTNLKRELRGSQGMGVVSYSWFDRVLLPILYMFKPSCWPVLKPPSLRPPKFPLDLMFRDCTGKINKSHIHWASEQGDPIQKSLRGHSTCLWKSLRQCFFHLIFRDCTGGGTRIAPDVGEVGRRWSLIICMSAPM